MDAGKEMHKVKEYKKKNVKEKRKAEKAPDNGSTWRIYDAKICTEKLRQQLQPLAYNKGEKKYQKNKRRNENTPQSAGFKQFQ